MPNEPTYKDESFLTAAPSEWEKYNARYEEAVFGQERTRSLWMPVRAVAMTAYRMSSDADDRAFSALRKVRILGVICAAQIGAIIGIITVLCLKL